MQKNPNFIHVATISSQRQITLPQYLLDKMGLKPKRKVSIELLQGIAIIKPVVISVKKLSGSLSRKGQRLVE